MPETEDSPSLHPPGQCFATTHWSVVLAAGQTNTPHSTEALEELCRTYWYPLYAFVRRKGHSAHDAQDLTQAFFARLLGKNYVAQADRERGRFRTYLLGGAHALSSRRVGQDAAVETRRRARDHFLRRGLSGGTLPSGANR